MSGDLPEEVAAQTAARSQDLKRRLRELKVENARLEKLLRLTPGEARPPSLTQSAIFDRVPGQVDVASDPATKVAFYRALFGARTDVYAVRWANGRSRRSGWMPAVAGGFRKGQRAADRRYLPLTNVVVEEHLPGDVHLGLYLMKGDSVAGEEHP